MSEAFFEIRVGDTDVEMRQDNTTIFRHLGNAAMFDHLFVNFGESAGAYMWATHSQYEEVSELAEAALCVQHLNLPEAAECDVNAYVRHNTDDIETFQIPGEWIDEAQS